MIELAGFLLIFIFVATGLFHFYWAAGGKWASNSVVPEHGGEKVFEPTPLATLIVAFGLLSFAAITMVASGIVLFETFEESCQMIMLGIAAIFLIRAVGEFRYVGFFKKVKGSSFARLDSFFYSPLCLLIAALAVFVALY